MQIVWSVFTSHASAVWICSALVARFVVHVVWRTGWHCHQCWDQSVLSFQSADLSLVFAIHTYILAEHIIHITTLSCFMTDVVIVVLHSEVSVYHFLSWILTMWHVEFAKNVCIIFLSHVIDSSQCSEDCLDKREDYQNCSVLCCVL